MSTTLSHTDTPQQTTAPSSDVVPSPAADNGAPSNLAERFGITEKNLADRRSFIGLGASDRTLLLEFVDWARTSSLTIAKDLLDHQFAFAPARNVFERRAKAKGLSIEAMRETLERTQATHFTDIFTGAASNWDLTYFEQSLQVGWVHAQSHLPSKWYIGAYPELLRITRVHLRRSGIPETRANKVIESLNKVLNLDIQAIGDSILLNTLALCGLDISAIMNRKGSDRTEHLDQVQLAVSMLIKQADALADDRLRDTVLERQLEVAGKLGDAFARTHTRLIKLSNQADFLAKGDLRHASVLSLENVERTEVLGNAMKRLFESLKQVTMLASEIGEGNFPAALEPRCNNDELVDAFNHMVSTIQRLIDDLNRMSISHNAGEIDVRMAAETFQGAFRKVAEGVNEMTNGHIGTTSLAMACVDEFARGNFEASFLPLPGKKRFINDAIEGMRSNLALLIADTNLLAQAAGSKNLKTRVDVDRHQGGYKKIIEAINTTLDLVVEPLRATAESASTLSASAEQLTSTSRQMVFGAEETAREASVVSESSSQISQSVNNMAASSEEMLASIREISRSANEAARVAKAAVGVATTTNKTIAQLGESSVEIGKVVKVITSIAQQTNLLALNATIEAARAGEAGKGFAVVANEVKELAKETARATEEISRKIETIQADTQSAVRAIAEVGSIIGTVNDISNSIASAVEEQTATTNEIGRNVHEAANGTADISKNISSVARVATETAKGAKEAESAAKTLTDLSARMKDLVAGFRF
jgi:methyl-accepting chemotaxis protein